MTGPECEMVRDLLPEWAAGSLDKSRGTLVETHVRECPDCRADLDVIYAVRSSQAPVPSQLEAKIAARVREELGAESPAGKEENKRGLRAVARVRWAPAWALSAAAAVILALGIGVIWTPGPSESVQDPIEVASQELLPEAWLWDDGMVAGAPVFDGLSDEELEALLEEFEG